MTFIATSNVPGYMPLDDEPPEFDSPREAWLWLAEQRERDEEDLSDDPEFSQTVVALRYLAGSEHRDGDALAEWPTDRLGCGVVHGDTPGYDGDHDMGIGYHVNFENRPTSNDQD